MPSPANVSRASNLDCPKERARTTSKPRITLERSRGGAADANLGTSLDDFDVLYVFTPQYIKQRIKFEQRRVQVGGSQNQIPLDSHTDTGDKEFPMQCTSSASVQTDGTWALELQAQGIQYRQDELRISAQLSGLKTGSHELDQDSFVKLLDQQFDSSLWRSLLPESCQAQVQYRYAVWHRAEAHPEPSNGQRFSTCAQITPHGVFPHIRFNPDKDRFDAEINFQFAVKLQIDLPEREHFPPIRSLLPSSFNMLSTLSAKHSPEQAHELADKQFRYLTLARLNEGIEEGSESTKAYHSLGRLPVSLNPAHSYTPPLHIERQDHYCIANISEVRALNEIDSQGLQAAGYAATCKGRKAPLLPPDNCRRFLGQASGGVMIISQRLIMEFLHDELVAYLGLEPGAKPGHFRMTQAEMMFRHGQALRLADYFDSETLQINGLLSPDFAQDIAQFELQLSDHSGLLLQLSFSLSPRYNRKGFIFAYERKAEYKHHPRCNDFLQAFYTGLDTVFLHKSLTQAAAQQMVESQYDMPQINLLAAKAAGIYFGEELSIHHYDYCEGHLRVNFECLNAA